MVLKIAEIVVVIPAACVLVYAFVRVVACAWFRTRAEFESRERI